MKHFFAFTLMLIAAHFSFGQTSTYLLEHNDVRATLPNGGTFFNNSTISSPGYEYPVGSDNHLIFSSSFWFGGEDINGQLKLSGQKYNPEEDLYPGTLSTVTGNPVLGTTLDQVYTVYKSEIDNHIVNYAQTGYTIPNSISEWPAHGDVALDEDFYMAPFVDTDGDGIYDPAAGDYPKIRGDQAVYFIMHDNGIHNSSGGDALNIECHFMFYQFSSLPGYMSNTTFLNLKVINRGTQDYYDFMVGNFIDPDIGDANDDFMGCDSTLNLMYAYNGDTIDAEYQYTAPSIGVVSLNRDLNAVMNYSNFTGPAAVPSIASEFWLNMNGYFNDGTSFTVGGSGYGGTTATNFHYHGNPNVVSDWSEYGETNPPTDKKMMMSVSPTFLGTGEEICYDFAYIIGDGSNHLANVDSLLLIASEVKNYYDAQTDYLCDNYEATLGIGKQFVEEIVVYPNPSNGILKVDLPGSFNIEVYTASGQLVYQGKELTKNIPIRLDVESGVYVLKINQGNQTLSKRISIL